MIYEIYGKTRQVQYYFGVAEVYGFSLDWRDDYTMKVRKRYVYKDFRVTREETDWIYTDDDHVRYHDAEYHVEKVAKTLHEDHARVYIDYVKDIEEDTESKTRAEHEKELYDKGYERKAAEINHQERIEQWHPTFAPIEEPKRWYQFWK